MFCKAELVSPPAQGPRPTLCISTLPVVCCEPAFLISIINLTKLLQKQDKRAQPVHYVKFEGEPGCGVLCTYLCASTVRPKCSAQLTPQLHIHLLFAKSVTVNNFCYICSWAHTHILHPPSDFICTDADGALDSCIHWFQISPDFLILLLMSLFRIKIF